jgi:putative flippase GtrA
MQSNKLQLLKFVIGGGINTGFTYGLYLALHLFLAYQVAYGIAYVAGIIFSYWFNSIFVFKTSLSGKGMATYPIVYVVQYAVSALLLATFVEGLSIPAEIAPLAVSLITIPVTFFMSRWIILRGKQNFS